MLPIFFCDIFPHYDIHITMFQHFISRYRGAIGALFLAVVVLFTACVCLFALSLTAVGAQRVTVVLDAGHGGIDGGVTGVKTGVKESEINLLLCRELQTCFEEYGVSVVQTRLSEHGLYGAATAGYKRRDMQKRAEIIREASPSIVLSIHQNSFALATRRGAQVFYRAQSEQSKTLANLVQNELNAMPECVRSFQPLVGDYYILNCSEYPSVIVECGFLTSPEDEALLLSQPYREQLAVAIVKGALTFLASSASG